VGAQFRQAGWVEAIVVARAAAFLFDQAGRLEYLQMLRHSRTADRKPARQLSDRESPVPQQVQNGLACGIGESAEHPRTVSHALR